MKMRVTLHKSWSDRTASHVLDIASPQGLRGALAQISGKWTVGVDPDMDGRVILIEPNGRYVWVCCGFAICQRDAEQLFSWCAGARDAEISRRSALGDFLCAFRKFSKAAVYPPLRSINEDTQ